MNQASVMSEVVRDAVAKGFRIVYCDEMMVTKSTFPKREWAPFKENICLDNSTIDTRPIAVLGAVSRELGIELVMPFEKSVKIPKFKVFLEEYR
jgi:transposase